MLLLQAGVLAITLLKLDRRIQRSQRNLLKANSTLRNALQNTGKLLERIAGLVEYMPTLESRANGLIDRLGAYLDDLDERSASGLVTASRKIEEGGRKFEYALSQFERQTSHLSRSVHYPAGQVSAVLKGIRAGLQAYREKDPQAPLQDEEIFI
jgi:hypothetical protein